MRKQLENETKNEEICGKMKKNVDNDENETMKTMKKTKK